MTQLRSATVLITGAAGGFGQELTRQLLAQGSQLILSDRPAIDLAAQTDALGISGAPGKIMAYLGADLATADGCEDLYRAVQQLNVAPDIVINNAGLALSGPMVDIPPERWETMVQVNLLAPMRLSSRFAADMIARRRGHIVNISSLAGWIAAPGLTAYAASKFGLRGFSEGLRYELAPYGVRVTTVYPFFSRTPLLDSPRFGALAQTGKDLPAGLTTEPRQIMARTIRAIAVNQDEVFPDRYAWIGQGLKRYTPFVTRWLSRRFYQTLTAE
ncbi:short-chain dehydrogenase [filamentous cyanobacterium CCP5]|nr:short-chain dehydrogenase [filamentous cyanobacterium CCP5]